MDIERRVVKSELVTGISRVSLIYACAVALLCDGYANGVIGSVNTILSTMYADYWATSGKNYSQTLSSLGFAGFIVGMLSFGYISDKFGRRGGMMVATTLVIIFSALSASSYAGGTVPGIVGTLSTWRFCLGIGLGAEYPCRTVAASEQSEEPGIARNSQHRLVALATDTMINAGFVVAAFVPLVLLWIFGMDRLSIVWRMSLGFAIVPAVIVFVWRLRMVETVRYSKDSMKHCKTPYWLTIRRYWKGMLAIGTIWFIYDFITYPFNIYSSSVVNSIIRDPNSLYDVFGWNVVINLFNMPGTIIGAFMIDYLDPKRTMILGLVLQAILGFFMCGFYEQLSSPSHIAGFAVLYGIFMSFGELGPGNNTLVLAAKMGPTAFRGEFFGFAAAMGKLGAFVGIWAFPPMVDTFGGSGSVRGNTGPFWIGSALALLNAVITYFFIPRIDHDGMIAEDLAFRIYLQEHGYDTSQMGLKEELVSMHTMPSSEELQASSSENSKDSDSVD